MRDLRHADVRTGEHRLGGSMSSSVSFGGERSDGVSVTSLIIHSGKPTGVAGLSRFLAPPRMSGEGVRRDKAALSSG